MADKLLGNLSTGLVFVLSAPAGTGKTTLVKMLQDEFPCVAMSVSCTTRAPRAGEISEKDYHFLSKKEFEAKIKADDFLEYAKVFDNFYGTSREFVEKQQTLGKHVFLVIDTQGALQLKKRGFPAVYVFLSPPSIPELRERLFKRKTESDEHIEQRLSWAENEIAVADHYDYHIVNANLQNAYEILRSILIAEEHKVRKGEF